MKVKETNKMDDFDKEVKRQYDEMKGKEQRLKKELADIGKKLKSLRLYLVETGMVEKKAKKGNTKLIS
jgi:hypothetical protein